MITQGIAITCTKHFIHNQTSLVVLISHQILLELYNHGYSHNYDMGCSRNMIVLQLLTSNLYCTVLQWFYYSPRFSPLPTSWAMGSVI